MNKVFTFLLLLTCSPALFAQVLPIELQTPEIVSVNRMPMRASAFSYENEDLAQKGVKENSVSYLSLNGDWKFNWVQNPADRPNDFFKTDYNDKDWKNFKVPANWELNGYGLPIYVNHPYEFTGRSKTGARLNPPFDIPNDNNPVGSYRKKFVLPENWNGKQVFIHLGAVKSAFFVWINGVKVGYSEDSKLAAEFDITKFIRPGENLVGLQVYRWSDGSYVECQDMWRISGIERDVYIYSTPKLHIRDFKISSTLTNNYTNGLFTLNAEVNSYRMDQKTLHSRPDTFSLDIELIDATAKSIFKLSTSGIKTVLGNYKTVSSFNQSIPAVHQWSAEEPYLYTLYISLKDKKGKLIEVIPVKVGFRSVEINENNFLVNGKRVFLKGVNRHEHNPRTGHAITKEDMRKDMEMMKKLNVNAVRHSHYPPDPYWMELCDEYGLYVVDEANIESHGRYYDLAYTLGNDKQWRNVHMERITRMYERDKNHPSVITWSMGNEAGNGVNFYEGYEWLKKIDSRPVQYERAESDYNTDMIVPQYPDPDWLVKYANGNPNRLLIMSEYAHIMGNSLGNFKEYWEVIENNPNLQGGFIWEWIDQSIDTIKNGKRIMAYGGDFPLDGPVQQNFSDNNFCVKGVVTAYRQLTPMAVEIKKIYQHVKSGWKKENTLEVSNRYFFRNLENVQLNWAISEEGIIIEKGIITDLSILPQQTKYFKLPIHSKQKDEKEYFLNVHFTLKQSEPFLEPGYEIAYDQFVIKERKKNIIYNPKKGTLVTKQEGGNYTVSGKDFTVSFDLATGTLNHYSVKGKKLLVKGPQPSFWRAPTDNDIGAGYNKTMRIWRNVYEENKIVEAVVKQIEKGIIEIKFKKGLLNDDAFAAQLFTIYSDGSVLVKNEFIANSGNHKMMMRFGNDMEVNKEYGSISWYGRGPWENYWDRKTASLTGLYNQTVDKQYFPYARPQESGNKSDVRWVSLTNTNGKGLRIIYIDSLLNFSALPYSLDDLDPEIEKKQYHSGELIKRDLIYFHIDLQQIGVQGIDSWGAEPLEKYRLAFKNYQYSYWILPVK